MIETLRGLADLNDWRNLEVLIAENPFLEISPEVTALFCELGAARESAGDRIGALHCYRLAIWNNAVYVHAAPESEEWQRRWWIGSDARWEFKRLQRDLPPQPPHGEPITSGAFWSQHSPRLQELAKDGEYERADTLLVMLESLPDDSSVGSIMVADRLEKMGDSVAAHHREAAAWFYRMASRRFRTWVASSSSGGEGLARSEETDTAAVKLAALMR